MIKQLEIREFNKVKDIDVFREEYAHMTNTFFNPQLEMKLFELPIVIDKKSYSGLNERFLHSVSFKEKIIKDKDKFYPPCTNELSSEVCTTHCQINNSNFIFQNIKRVPCLYRLSRIRWIDEVLKMVEDNDVRVKVWKYEKKDKTNNKWEWKWYVLFKQGVYEFLIVLREDQKENGAKELNFRTAYPVYLPGDKVKLNKEYLKALKSGNCYKK